MSSNNIFDENGFRYDLLFVVIFWAGVIGIVNTFIDWYNATRYNGENYYFRMLVYLLLTILGFLILSWVNNNEDDNCDTESYDSDE